MKKTHDGEKTNIVYLWSVVSIIFAAIIHILFCIPAPAKWLVAKWGAGDILTYASTVSLGLLAIWQNQKFKEENDISQARIENLTNKANELSIIGKIIERETEKITLLKTKTQHFLDACNTESISEDLSDVANQPVDFMKIYVKIKMDNRKKQIIICTVELLSELKSYPNNSKAIELIQYITEYSNASIALVNDMRTTSIVEEKHIKKPSLERNFIVDIYNFISDRENLLQAVIYENLSIEQIKAQYTK